MYRSRPNAPFKAPRLVRKVDDSITEPIAKKRSLEATNQEPARRPVKTSKTEIDSEIENETQKDLQKQPNTPKTTQFKRVINIQVGHVKPIELKTDSQLPTSKERYAVQWRKRTNKKNKTWDGDGYIVVYRDAASNSSFTIAFKQLEAKNVIRKQFTNVNVDQILRGLITIGQNELEVDYMINTDAEFRRLTGEEEEGSESLSSNLSQSTIPSKPSKPMAYRKMIPKNYEVTTSNRHTRAPLYNDSRAIALPRPPGVNENELVDVLIDPHLSVKLRPHQVEGVKFVYECLMGFRGNNGKGCLLADEMGLGKTLMTITVIWTLCRQNPFIKQPRSTIHKVLICCPVSLINNWKDEFKKWLGMNKLSILTLGGNVSSNDRQDLVSFGNLNVYQVLIMNYEKVTTYHQELSKIRFDLLVCDEGHRLKSSSNKVMNHLTLFNIPRKILLTGTPIQNDLVEYYTIINFINPGILGDFKSFQKSFINPITRSRDVTCFDPVVKEQGLEISNKLIDITKQFTLRRTQSLLLNYLTEKTDVILYAPPTDLQKRLFSYIINLKSFNELMNDSASTTTQAFTLINLFKKLCNSPSLLLEDNFFSKLIKGEKEEIELLNKNTLTTSSGKINILIPLLLEITSFNEKIVLVSNYTKTLDLLEAVLKKLDLSFLRLDGSTAKNLRNKLVNQFNKSNINVFLLSSKSGGMGLNLVGASRLILFDNDWNPSVDLQSMSRIHRDGQTRPCFIYRILTTGTIDEKIFQRQLMKSKLSSKFLDNESQSTSDVFDYRDLKNLFEIEENTISNTHDLLECECTGDGHNISVSLTDSESDSDAEGFLSAHRQSLWMSALDLRDKLEKDEKKKLSIKDALNEYRHFDPATDADKVCQHINDKVLVNIINNKGYNKKTFPISFIMTRVSDRTTDKGNSEVSSADSSEIEEIA